MWYQIMTAKNQIKGAISRLMILLLSIASHVSLGQASDDAYRVDTAQVVVKARATEDGVIRLRWAVTTPRAWRKCNGYGYHLTRYTILRDGKELPHPIAIDFGVIMPEPLSEWEEIVQTNDNAAIIAQSLYGESFYVAGAKNLGTIVNLSQEQQQRFTWALYAADQDFEAALMGGLGYVDENAKPNEKYLYRVSAAVPQDLLPIKKSSVYVGSKDYEPLPKPLGVVAIFSDSQTELSWDYQIYKELYNSYFIERSADGEIFERLNDLPMTGLNNSGEREVKRLFYLDSIQNNETYYYRVVGRTYFGEESEPSEIVMGHAEATLKFVPRITYKYYQDENSIKLQWEFDEQGNELIHGFELNRSDQIDGKYERVMQDIAPHLREIRYDSLLPTNYMTITAVGKQGGNRVSAPVLVQPVDSIPPVKPVGLTGEIDSTGIVTLQWASNTEKDMLGYRVYRGNNKNEEYSQITVSPHQDTIYYDTVGVKNLNSKVYYQVIAVDQRFNMSDPSVKLEVKKPDFIPPTQPVIRSYEIKDGAVQLTWIPSSSIDVVTHELYRRESGYADWLLQHSSNTDEENTQTDWKDTDIKEGRRYQYTLIAIDESGLESEPAPPLAVTIPKTSMKPAVDRLGSYIDKKNGYIEIFWKAYKQPYVSVLEIYKGVGEEPVSLLKHVAADTRRVVDEKTKANNTYTYMIRAVFKDGSFSETAQINVKF